LLKETTGDFDES